MQKDIRILAAHRILLKLLYTHIILLLRHILALEYISNSNHTIDMNISLSKISIFSIPYCFLLIKVVFGYRNEKKDTSAKLERIYPASSFAYVILLIKQ